MIVTQIPISIPLHQVYRYLGFQNERNVTPEWENQVKQAIKQAKIFLNPKGIVETKEVCPELLDQWEWNSLKYGGKQVKRILSRSTKVSFIVATIGEEFEKKLNETAQNGSLTTSYLWDVIGTVAVHQTVEGLKKHIKPFTRQEGLRLSPRMAPGYGDWRMEAQTLFFQNLHVNKLGMKINDSFLMEPKHSLTGMIAWTTQHQMKDTENKCATCIKVDCLYRTV